MRAPGDILLISCYELGHQPLGVAWPAAFLERAGYAPAVMDVAVEPFDPEPARRARLVAIAVPMHTALRLGTAVARRIREAGSTAHLCFHGLYAALNADYLLAHGADTVIAGEAEDALLGLVRALEAGVDRPVPGVMRRGVPATPVLERLPFPVPSRGALPPLRKYARLERDGRVEIAGHVEASRGCRHRCRHCPIPPVYGGRFFAVPREVVLADIRQQVAAGARHITFGDPDFLNGPRHALDIARALHAEFPGVSFDFTAKVEHLVRDERHLAEFARLGCVFIVSAVESLSDVVLGHLDKGHTRADVHRVLAATREAGIALRPTWVPFTPWTTLDDYHDMLDFTESEGLLYHVDPVQYGIRLLVPPGSLLASSLAMAPFLGELIPDAFHYRWTHPDPRMDVLCEEVAATVARATERGDDTSATFEAVRDCADRAVGERPARRTPVVAAGRAPRLTEPWFC